MITETIDEMVLVEAIGTAGPDYDALVLTVEAIASPLDPCTDPMSC